MFYLHFTITKETYIQFFYFVHIGTNVSVTQKGRSFNYFRAFKGFTEVKKFLFTGSIPRGVFCEWSVEKATDSGPP